jgi:hypothetical protein
MHEFNTERPHEALAMKCPAELYGPSPRRYNGLPRRSGRAEPERTRRRAYNFRIRRALPWQTLARTASLRGAESMKSAATCESS